MLTVSLHGPLHSADVFSLSNNYSYIMNTIYSWIASLIPKPGNEV